MAENAFDVQSALDGLAVLFPLNERHRLLVFSGGSADVSFCVPPPLGLAECGESQFPYYVHVDVDTSASEQDPLSVLIEELEAGVPSVRQDSHKQIVVVTDADIASDAASAEADLRALGPAFATARVHAMSGGGGGGCEPSPELEALAEQTFGLSGSLCPMVTEDVFPELVAEWASCVFDVPGVDASAVESVSLYAEDDASELDLVEDLSACGTVELGASLVTIDDEQKLILCPATCDVHQGGLSISNGGVRATTCS